MKVLTDGADSETDVGRMEDIGEGRGRSDRGALKVLTDGADSEADVGRMEDTGAGGGRGGAAASNLSEGHPTGKG